MQSQGAETGPESTTSGPGDDVSDSPWKQATLKEGYGSDCSRMLVGGVRVRLPTSIWQFMLPHNSVWNTPISRVPSTRLHSRHRLVCTAVTLGIVTIRYHDAWGDLQTFFNAVTAAIEVCDKCKNRIGFIALSC